jgi:hypothetical protein
MKETDYEAWARLLISRKVPDRYRHLVNSDVVGRGATILKLGEAFEVHVEKQADGQISVTPLPHSRGSARL